MIWLRTFLYYSLFATWTLVIATALVPLALMARPVTLRRYAILWPRGVVWLARWILGQRLEVRGLEHLPKGACLLAAQHQAAYDIYAVGSATPDSSFVLKQSLSRIPLVGWLMVRSGSIPIDRGAGGAALRKILKGARGVFEGDRPLIIFPEGTRTPLDRAQPYQPGVAALYSHFKDVPLIPVATNAGLFWPRSSFKRLPGKVIYEFLPPLERDLSKTECLAAMRARITAASAALIAETDPAVADAFRDAQLAGEGVDKSVGEQAS